MKVRPLHDRLLVRRIEEKETAKGGIIIPDTAKEKPMEGEVLAVGNRQDPGERDEARPGREGRGHGSCSASTPGPRSRSTARKC